MILICLIFVLTGGLTINQVQFSNDKKTQEKYKNLLEESKKLTERAELLISENELSDARTSIKKIPEKESLDLVRRLDQVTYWWKQVNRAERLVTGAEKIQNDVNVERSQKAIDRLTVGPAYKKKVELQTRLNIVKTVVSNNKRRAILKEQH